MLSSNDEVCSVSEVGLAGATCRGSDSTIMSKLAHRQHGSMTEESKDVLDELL